MRPKLAPDRSGSESVPPLAEEFLREAYDRVLRACRSRGLTAHESADVAQDLFLWLLLHPDRFSLLSPLCMKTVVGNYVMRYRSRARLREIREGRRMERTPQGNVELSPACDETTLSVDRLVSLLPAIESAVLTELRHGSTWAEATARLGVPPGSRNWLRKRMAEHVRQAFRPRILEPGSSRRGGFHRASISAR